MRFDHINLSASAELMEVLKEFYCDVLDLSVGPRPEIPIPGYWLYDKDNESALIHMIEAPDHRPPEMSHLDHVAFNATDLAPIKSRLDQRSVEYGFIELPDFGIEQIQFLDPAGVKIEINCYTEKTA